MTSGLNFWDIDVWTFVITLSILFGGMLVANALRRKVPFLRKSLIPSSVLGGFLILGVNAVYKLIFGSSMFSLATMEALTYHGLGLGFVALAWRNTGSAKGKKAKRDVFSTSTVVVGAYLIQALAGLVISIALFYLIGSFAGSGVILPMGYGQGPGQALNWGNIYQNNWGFEYGASFGLTVAAMGFVSASVGGVYYLNRMRRNGDPRAQIANAEEIEDLNATRITEKGEIPMAESLDKFTVQFAIIFVTYAVSFALMWAVSLGLDKLGGFWANTVKPLIWGFNFLVGTAVAILGKKIFGGFRSYGVISRSYTNDFMLNRTSGLMFDIMVTASIAAIDLSAFKHKEFVLPLILICAAGFFVTYFYCKFLCPKLFPEYSDDAFLSLFGMLTGTASTGIILLREIDPLFETPASHNLIYQNLWAILLGFPMLLLMGIVPQSITMTWICFGGIIALFAGICFIQSRLFRSVKRDKAG